MDYSIAASLPERSAVVTRRTDPAMARDLADFHEFPASDASSALARTADLSRQNAVLGFSLLIAAFWAILDEMRGKTGAENLPPFPLVRIENRR